MKKEVEKSIELELKRACDKMKIEQKQSKWFFFPFYIEDWISCLLPLLENKRWGISLMCNVLTLLVFHGILNSILNKLSSQNHVFLYVHNRDQVVHNNISHCLFSHEDYTFCYFFWYEWGRKWQPTPLFLPGESHGQRTWADYSP